MCTDANSKGMVMAQNSSYNNAAIGLLLVACNGTLWYGGKVKILAVDYNVMTYNNRIFHSAPKIHSGVM